MTSRERRNSMNVVDTRAEIHRVISSINPLDNFEQEHIDFVLQWIESGCEIFRREMPATPDTHLVSYFVIVDQNTNQILLTDHKKSGLWLPPGGKENLQERNTTSDHFMNGVLFVSP